MEHPRCRRLVSVSLEGDKHVILLNTAGCERCHSTPEGEKILGMIGTSRLCLTLGGGGLGGTEIAEMFTCNIRQEVSL